MELEGSALTLEKLALAPLEAHDTCQCHFPKGAFYSLDVGHLARASSDLATHRAHPKLTHPGRTGNLVGSAAQCVVLIGVLTPKVDAEKRTKTPHIWQFTHSSGVCDCVIREPLHFSPNIRVAVTCWNYIPACVLGSEIVCRPTLEIICARGLPCGQALNSQHQSMRHNFQPRPPTRSEVSGTIVLLSTPAQIGGDWIFTVRLSDARTAKCASIIFKGTGPMRWHSVLSVAVSAWNWDAAVTVAISNVRRAKLRHQGGGRSKVLVADDASYVTVAASSPAPHTPACVPQGRSIATQMSRHGQRVIDSERWKVLASQPASINSDQTLHYVGTATSADPVTSSLILDGCVEVMLLHFPASSVPGLRSGCKVLLLNLQTFCNLDGAVMLAATSTTSIIPVVFPACSTSLLHWTAPPDVADILLECQHFGLQDAEAVVLCPLRFLPAIRGSLAAIWGGFKPVTGMVAAAVSREGSLKPESMAGAVKLIWESLGHTWPGRIQSSCPPGSPFSKQTKPTSSNLLNARRPRIYTLEQVLRTSVGLLQQQNAECSCRTDSCCLADHCWAVVHGSNLGAQEAPLFSLLEIGESSRMVLRDASGQIPLILSGPRYHLSGTPVMVNNFSVGLCGIKLMGTSTTNDATPTASTIVTGRAVFANSVDCVPVCHPVVDVRLSLPVLSKLEFFVVVKLAAEPRRPEDDAVVECMAVPLTLAGQQVDNDCTSGWPCTVMYGPSRNSHQDRLCWSHPSGPAPDIVTIHVSTVGLEHIGILAPGSWIAAMSSPSGRNASTGLLQAQHVCFLATSPDLNRSRFGIIDIVLGDLEPLRALQQAMDMFVAPFVHKVCVALAGQRVHDMPLLDAKNRVVSLHGRVGHVSVLSFRTAVGHPPWQTTCVDLEGATSPWVAAPLQPAHLSSSGLRTQLAVTLLDCATADKIICYVDPCTAGIPDGFVPGVWVSLFNCKRSISQVTQKVYLAATSETRIVVTAGTDQVLCQNPCCSTTAESVFAIPKDAGGTGRAVPNHGVNHLDCLSSGESNSRTLRPTSLLGRARNLLRLEIRLKHDLRCIIDRAQRHQAQFLSSLSEVLHVIAQVTIEDGTGSTECLVEGRDALLAIKGTLLHDFTSLIMGFIDNKQNGVDQLLEERLQRDIEESASGARQVMALLLVNNRLVMRNSGSWNWHPVLGLEAGPRGAEEQLSLNLLTYGYLHSIFRAAASSPDRLMLCQELRRKQHMKLGDCAMPLAPTEGSRQMRVLYLSSAPHAATARGLLEELKSHSST